jgi:hypothetical protein
MNIIEGFTNYDESIVLVNESIMLSDPTLDAIIYEMTRHYHVLNFGELMDKYSDMELHYAEGRDDGDCGTGCKGNIRITEG